MAGVKERYGNIEGRINLEGLPIGLYKASMDGRLLEVNRACLSILRCPGKEELTARNARDLYVNTAEADTFWHSLRKKGYVREVEVRLWRWDNTIVWVNVAAHAVYDDLGKVVYIEGSFQDITERKENERRLVESEARFRGLAERCSDIIVLFDKTCRPVFWSPSSEKILGFSADELMSMSIDRLMASSDYEKMREYVISVLKGRAPANFEAAVIRKDGCEAVIEWSAAPVHDGRNVTGMQLLGRDVTERRRAEEALRKSHEELRSLSKHLEAAREQERKNIARELHDDLGQALTAVKFDLAWLRRHLPDEGRGLGEKLEGSIRKVDEAIKSVKRITSMLRPEILNDLGLEAAMEWYMDEFSRHTGIAGRAKISLSPLCPSDLDDAVCVAVFRIFQEALTNAAKHSGATEMLVSLVYEDCRINLTVRDNGRGIENDGKNSESFGLLGIRERVNSMRGEMHISGSAEKGTVLEVSLPLSGDFMDKTG